MWKQLQNHYLSPGIIQRLSNCDSRCCSLLQGVKSHNGYKQCWRFQVSCGLRLVRGSSLLCHLWWRRSLSRPLLQRARHVLLIIEYVLFVWVWPLVVCQGHHGISYLLKDPQDAFFLVSLIWFLKCCVPCCLIYLLLNYYHLATWKPIEVDWGC